jgi:hypothetical protein
MAHPLYNVTTFEVVGPYTLRVMFDDGAQQVINFEPVLHGEMLGPLRELRVFEQVCLDPETSTLTWPNGADFDPWMLHEWPGLAEALAACAQSWTVL